jgi:hypothetical protein
VHHFAYWTSFVTHLGAVLTFDWRVQSRRFKMVSTGQKKVCQTFDELCQIFTRVNADLGPGSTGGRGETPLHPIGHWMPEMAVKSYSEEVFQLESIQIIRTKNWLEQGLRKDGVREYSVLERLIAACMEYSARDYEFSMRVFFVEWEKNLKSDGRTTRNKDQWIRWCEVHLIRHHRASKAVRFLEVLQALGLIYPGWWKQVYAAKHNTPVHNDTYEFPWDVSPDTNTVSAEEQNTLYANFEVRARAKLQAAARIAPPTIQPPAAITASSANESEENKLMRTTKTSRFQEDLDMLDNAFTDSTPAKDTENESEESFRPEDHYPGYIHEYDAIMGTPKTTNPQLAHTVSFAPAADAWRNLSRDGFEGATQFNPEINATRIVDSAAQEAVRPRPAPRTNAGLLPSGSSFFQPPAHPAPRVSAGPTPHTNGGHHARANHLPRYYPGSALGTLPTDPRQRATALALPVDAGPLHDAQYLTTPSEPAGIDWDNIDERDWAYAVSEVDADFFPQSLPNNRPRNGLDDLPNDTQERQRIMTKRNELYNVVAGLKNVPAADLARRIAEREVEFQAHEAAPRGEPKVMSEQEVKDLGFDFAVQVNSAMYPPDDD